MHITSSLLITNFHTFKQPYVKVISYVKLLRWVLTILHVLGSNTIPYSTFFGCHLKIQFITCDQRSYPLWFTVLSHYRRLKGAVSWSPICSLITHRGECKSGVMWFRKHSFKIEGPSLKLLLISTEKWLEGVCFFPSKVMYCRRYWLRLMTSLPVFWKTNGQSKFHWSL